MSQHTKSPLIPQMGKGRVDDKGAIVRTETREMRVEIHSPLPPADYLATYRCISSEAPQQLMEIFLKQANHRMECERKDLNARIWLRIVGQGLGILFALSALTAGTLVAFHGATGAATALFVTTIPSCAVIFVLGRESREKATKPPQP
ncbi:MAG: DUF2335 domain-containing protein [Kiritimatiellia bacterium]